jgi:hypothetical protein
VRSFVSRKAAKPRRGAKKTSKAEEKLNEVVVHYKNEIELLYLIQVRNPLRLCAYLAPLLPVPPMRDETKRSCLKDLRIMSTHLELPVKPRVHHIIIDRSKLVLNSEIGIEII